MEIEKSHQLKEKERGQIKENHVWNVNVKHVTKQSKKASSGTIDLVVEKKKMLPVKLACTFQYQKFHINDSLN